MVTRPLVGSTMPAMDVNNVVFPEPLGPMTATSSPLRATRFASHSAVTAVRPLPYTLLWFSIRTTSTFSPGQGRAGFYREGAPDAHRAGNHAEPHDHREQRQLVGRLHQHEPRPFVVRQASHHQRDRVSDQAKSQRFLQDQPDDGAGRSTDELQESDRLQLLQRHRVDDLRDDDRGRDREEDPEQEGLHPRPRHAAREHELRLLVGRVRGEVLPAPDRLGDRLRLRPRVEPYEDGVDRVQIGIVGELAGKHLGQSGLRRQGIRVGCFSPLPQITDRPVVLHELDLLRIGEGEERDGVPARSHYAACEPDHGVVVQPEMQLRPQGQIELRVGDHFIVGLRDAAAGHDFVRTAEAQMQVVADDHKAQRPVPPRTLDRIDDVGTGRGDAGHDGHAVADVLRQARLLRKGPTGIALHDPDIRSRLIDERQRLVDEPVVDAAVREHEGQQQPDPNAGKGEAAGATANIANGQVHDTSFSLGATATRAPSEIGFLPANGLTMTRSRSLTPLMTSTNLRSRKPNFTGRHRARPSTTASTPGRPPWTTRVISGTRSASRLRAVSMYTSVRCPRNRFADDRSKLTSTSRSSVTRSTSALNRATWPGCATAGSVSNTTRAGWPTCKALVSRSSTCATTHGTDAAMRKIGAPGTTVEPTSRFRVITRPAAGLTIRVSASFACATPRVASALVNFASATLSALSSAATSALATESLAKSGRSRSTSALAFASSAWAWLRCATATRTAFVKSLASSRANVWPAVTVSP